MHRWIVPLALVVLWLSACVPQVTLPLTATPTSWAGQLTPYRGPGPSQTPTPLAESTVTPLPSATPTPQTHVVQAGEDMFGLAYRYGLSLDALMTANPTINPRAMSVGSVLVIPYGGRPTPTAQNPTPTPLPLEVGQPACYSAKDGSLTCLIPVFNGTGAAVENLSGRLRLQIEPEGELRELPAYPALNRLPAGESLPLVADLPAPAPQVGEASAELDTALPVAEGDARYLPVQLAGEQVAIAADGLSATVSGQVSLADDVAQPAQTVWALAVAYDAGGHMVGVRRWENSASLTAGQAMDFSLTVYSLEGVIARVDTLLEARP
jgi:hypothetical protein